MNKKKKKETISISELVGTVIVTIIMVFCLCMATELQLYFNIEQVIAKKQIKLKNLVKFFDVEELEKMHLAKPNDSMIALNLAKAYEAIEDYRAANKMYKKAIMNTYEPEYAIYSYAIFCAKMGWYGLCADLAEEIYSKNKTGYKYKAEIYETLAKSFDINNEYEASVKAYSIALKYAKNAKKNKLLETIKDEYSKEYIKLADYNITQNKTEDAILNLKNSMRIKEQNLAKYKLALIYKDTDKYTAEKYFNEVLKNDPYIINPYIYNSLLQELIIESKNKKNMHSVDFYKSRLNYLINVIQKKYIYKDDIVFSDSHLIEYKKLFNKKRKYELNFSIKNNTKIEINKLFVKAELLVGDELYTVSDQIIDSVNPIDANKKFENMKLELPEDFSYVWKDKDISHGVITIRYYVKRQQKAPWTLAKIEFVKFK